MKRNTGKAAAWLPFLRFSRMSRQIPIRITSAATLLWLAIVVVMAFAGAQTGSKAYSREASQMSVPLVSPQEMTAEDRATAQSWQPAIAASAQFFGYTLDASYGYREIACPVAPDHLLLAYQATSANGFASRFTAVVRRGAEEKIAGSHRVAQIIPILHFGVVPFVPAIANPHSIEVFNAAISPAPSATEVLSANQAGNQPLLVRALCYLAIVGEEPAALSSPPSSQATIHAPIPTLVFQNKSKIRQQISVRGSQGSYQVWALTFQSGGKLMTATRQEHPIDRTPLVLSATNGGSPEAPPGMTASGAHMSPQPSTPVAATPPTASAALIATPVAPAESAAPRLEQPATPVANAEAAEIPAPSAPAVNPATPERPPSATPSSAATPAITAKVETSQPAPQPPLPSSLPAAAAAPAPAAIFAPSAPSTVFVATPPLVKPSPPLPVGRFIQNLPQPPSKFIPDSALKTPPHLPQ